MNGYIYRIGSPTNVIGRPPHFYSSDQLIARGCQFGSVYAVTEEAARSIGETSGTASGFRGIVWSRRLWVDFDNEEAADKAEAFLTKEGYDYVAYHTGGRGKHFGILRAALPSHTLPMQDKLWVSQNLPGCDLSLYWHLHLIRLPGAVHERTGLTKRFLYRREGRELTLPPYLPEEAKIVQTGLVSSAYGRQSIFKLWEVTSKLTEDPSQSRHRHLVLLAKALKEEGRVSPEEALWVVTEVNMGFSDPKPENEVQRIVKWAYGIGE